MAKDKAAAPPTRIEASDGTVFGPCSECTFYISGEGLGSSVGKGRCHGMPPVQGMWPGVPGVALGCSIFRARS
jgi:hypothetical protein